MISKLLKKDKKGFTLMEMLIVVAIIAILVAIMIPTFNAQLEKAREAADAANIRAAYAEVMVKFLDDSQAQSEVVNLQQAKAGWQTAGIEDNLKQLVADNTAQNAYSGAPVTKGTCTVAVDAEGNVTIAYSGT